MKRDERTHALMHTLLQCITACEVCADACLDAPEPMQACIRLDRDCAEICALASRYVARGSAYAGRVLRLCIVICDACRAECARHDHWHCVKCAAVCAQCSEACREHLHRLAA